MIVPFDCPKCGKFGCRVQFNDPQPWTVFCEHCGWSEDSDGPHPERGTEKWRINTVGCSVADTPKEGWVYPTSRFVAGEDEIGMMYSRPRHDSEEVHYVRGDEYQETKRQRDKLLETIEAIREDVINEAGRVLPSTLLAMQGAINETRTAIAECDNEARNENDIARTQVPDAPHLRKRGA